MQRRTGVRPGQVSELLCALTAWNRAYERYLDRAGRSLGLGAAESALLARLAWDADAAAADPHGAALLATRGLLVTRTDGPSSLTGHGREVARVLLSHVVEAMRGDGALPDAGAAEAVAELVRALTPGPPGT